MSPSLGGFLGFSRLFPGLCEGKSFLVPSCISQPRLPVASVGPTRILPHLYLGCQRDVLNQVGARAERGRSGSDAARWSVQDVMQQNHIGFVLNASNTCPKPDFIPDSHFLRVPVNDSFCEKILPWLDRSVAFIGQPRPPAPPPQRVRDVITCCLSEEAKASNARVLVHCLAGISRSATIAIAYIMERMDLSLDEAYR